MLLIIGFSVIFVLNVRFRPSTPKTPERQRFFSTGKMNLIRSEIGVKVSVVITRIVVQLDGVAILDQLSLIHISEPTRPY